MWIASEALVLLPSPFDILMTLSYANNLEKKNFENFEYNIC
jgi:hypothetical protein